MSGNNIGEPTWALAFTASEWMLIRSGLYELPAKISVGVIGKLERAIQEAQQKTKEETRHE